ncbi:MAG: hypothetical protein OEV43_01295 [Coriobacteriia bacterium]|nr:hypothetical protein [Coriobacteriia bacterium]
MRKLQQILVLVLCVIAFGLSGCASPESSAMDVTWPTLESGKPSFYYFGAPS